MFNEYIRSYAFLECINIYIKTIIHAYIHVHITIIYIHILYI